MKFTTLAHAALQLEHRGTRVLIDPWLFGECYDGSWALLGEPDELVLRLERPQWLLYSHAHPDHFHVPTLRALAARFGADLPILIPRQLGSRFATALRALGLQNVTEVPPARPLQLGEDFALTIHPVRGDDSVQVFRAGDFVLINGNDCRLDDHALGQLVQRYRGADFYLGQHSIGDAYPFRLEGIDDDATAAAAAEPVLRFARQASAFEAKHAVPVASAFRFCHVDNVVMNDWHTTLDRLGCEGFASLRALYPGDGWSDDIGFECQRAHADAYLRATAAVREHTAPCRSREVPPPSPAVEAAAAERWAHVFSSLPTLVRRHMKAMAFHLDDLGRSLTIDWGRSRLHWGNALPDVPYYRLAAAHFLRVCESPHGFSTLHIASRFTAHGWETNNAIDLFLPVSILYSLGYFDGSPLSYLRPRALSAMWARRADIADVLPRLLRPRTGLGEQFWRL